MAGLRGTLLPLSLENTYTAASVCIVSRKPWAMKCGARRCQHETGCNALREGAPVWERA